MNINARHNGRVWILSGLLVCSLHALAADNNSRLYRPVDNWQVDGANGMLYVSGSLTESPCRLAMTSSYQSVELGNAETASFASVGAKGLAIPFRIELEDCIEMNTQLGNVQTGQTAWSSTQLAVKIRFVAPTVPQMPQLAKVEGVEGLGLAIETANGETLPLNRQSNPVLLPSGKDVLTYYVRPVRTTQSLQPGTYSALVAFEMLYE